MDTRRILFFLRLLSKETTGCENEIAELYQKALDDNDEIRTLKSMIDNCNFYGEIGGSLKRRSLELLDKIRSNPVRSLEMLPQVKLMHESIAQEINVCDERMLSPEPVDDTVTVMYKDDTVAYMMALRRIAATCVYLILLYEGPEKSRHLTWYDDVGIREMVYAVGTKFLPLLCDTRKSDYYWVITKRRLGGKALFGGDGFFLSYEKAKDIQPLCSILHQEPIGTHAFLNIDAYESDLNDVPYCWGIGNLTSITPNNSLNLLQQSITQKLRAPSYKELRRKMPVPTELTRLLSNGTEYCITPDDLLIAMNQWYVGHEIETRKQMHRCLFCGQHINGKSLVCPTHFSSEV